MVVVTTCNKLVLEQQAFKDKEPFKMKGVTNQKEEECLRNTFVDIIQQMQTNIKVGNLGQTTIEPFNTSWAGLSNTNILLIDLLTKLLKQLIEVIELTQIVKDILNDIGNQILNIKYTLNLGQLMKIIFNIKRFLT